MKKVKSIKLVKTNNENNLKSLNDAQTNEKTSSINNNNNTNTKNIIQANDISQDINKEKKNLKLMKFFEFPGFFFQKFNLTTYKKKRDDSRARSKSPERIYKLNHKKGNGIPDDLNERLKYLTKIINNEDFQNYYNQK